MLRERVIHTFRLEDGEEVTVGRGVDAGVRIDNPAVSRQHARLRLQDGSWRIEDLGSTNGTRLNGAKIDGSVSVRPGDRIELGKFVLVPIDEPAGQPQTASASDFEQTVFVRPGRKAAAPSGDRLPQLVTTGGSAVPNRLPLEGKAVVRIGKDPGCDVVVGGWLVPRTQCSIHAWDGAYYVTHHAGWRGTRVNGQKVRSVCRLAAGDILAVAGVTFRFE
jgi:pSer/pThr/pTyr-binding forkhead associated (FHA) protein